MPTRPAYPRHWEADIVARDGATMHVRPILPADAPGLQALHLAQSERSRFFRFFGHRGALTEAELERFTHVDHRDRVALVVTDRDGGPLLAFGCYDAVDARTAEVAFYVADSQQGRGLGSVLLDHLAAAGRERGFTRLVADVLPTNAKMLAVFREAGYTVDSGFEDGVVEVSVDLATTDKSWRVMTAREQFSESRSMRVLMDPGRILPVGAGRAARFGRAGRHRPRRARRNANHRGLRPRRRRLQPPARPQDLKRAWFGRRPAPQANFNPRDGRPAGRRRK